MSALPRRSYYPGLFLLLVAVLLGLWVSPAPAAEPKSSLDLVPDDAAFYSAMFQGRQRWDAVTQSRAWAKLRSLPIVQMGLGLYAIQAMDPESVPGKIDAALNDPAVQKTKALLADMFSHEVFVYGDTSCIEVLGLLQEVNGAQRFAPLFALMAGEADAAIEKNQIQARAVLSALVEGSDKLKVPDLVFGFKVKDAALARQQLAQLEKLVTDALAGQPDLRKRFKRSTVDGSSYLTLSLDGRMIPWDDDVLEAIRRIEASEGDAEKLVARLKESKLVIALGLRDDYLLLSIGSSTKTLAKLGRGKSLRSRNELAPLARFADKKLSGVGYASKAMSQMAGGTKEDIDGLVDVVKELLPEAKLPKEAKDEILSDVAALAKDLKTAMPETGAAMSFGFFTDSGFEGYGYNWGEHAHLDGSRPLGMLQHVGGDPMAWVVGRSKVSVEGYDMLAKWVGVGYRYFEKYAVPQIPEKERPEFDKFVQGAKPLVVRAHKATRDMLFPALADGQLGLVFDTKLASKRYLAHLPATEKPLPMIEPALVLGVSDPALLEKAIREYWAVGNGVVDVIRQIKDAKIPADFKLPVAKETKTSQGKIYTFDLPKEWGLDAQVRPTAGLSKQYAVLSISRQHAERLLADRPLKLGGRTIATDRPLAASAAFDFAALVEAIRPWVDLAFDQAGKESKGADMASYRQQAHTVLDVLKCFRNTISESYLEDKALVTHWQCEMRDVEK